jgi:hypothetical protein
VAAFIPIHVDRYSSEVADSRHEPMLALANCRLAPRPISARLAYGSRQGGAFDNGQVSAAPKPRTSL